MCQRHLGLEGGIYTFGPTNYPHNHCHSGDKESCDERRYRDLLTMPTRVLQDCFCQSIRVRHYVTDNEENPSLGTNMERSQWRQWKWYQAKDK